MNQALYYGNCIVFFGQNLTMIFSNWTNNSNVKSILYEQNIINLGFGGVIFDAGVVTFISNFLFEGNSNKMGGVFSFSLNVETLTNKILIQNSTFTRNKADQFGGTIYFPPGLIIFNCTIKNNIFLQNYANISKSLY